MVPRTQALHPSDNLNHLEEEDVKPDIDEATPDGRVVAGGERPARFATVEYCPD